MDYEEILNEIDKLAALLVDANAELSQKIQALIQAEQSHV